jgi:hypothetical protein
MGISVDSKLGTTGNCVEFIHKGWRRLNNIFEILRKSLKINKRFFWNVRSSKASVQYSVFSFQF